MTRAWRRTLLGMAASLLGLAITGLAVAGIFAAVLESSRETRPTAAVVQIDDNDGQREPDLVGRIAGVWGNTLAIDTPGGRRTVLLHNGTEVQVLGGEAASRKQLKTGQRAAVFGGLTNLQSFRADLIVLLPAR